MAKPSTLPEWNKNQSVPRTTTPPNGVKDDGVVPGDKLPAQWLNWFNSYVYKWCAYLDGLTGEALTWTVAQTFNAAINIGVVPAEWRSVLIGVFAAANGKPRIHYGNGTLSISVNASFDDGGTNEWTQDNPALNSFRVLISTSTGVRLQTMDAGHAPWADGGWFTALTANNSLDVAVGGNLSAQQISASDRMFSNTSRSSATMGAGQSVALGEFWRESACFAFGVVRVDPSGPSISLTRGMNIKSLTRIAAGKYDVELQTSAAHVLSPTVSAVDNSGSVAVIDSGVGGGSAPTTNTFRVLFYSGGVLSDPAGTGQGGFNFHVYQG